MPLISLSSSVSRSYRFSPVSAAGALFALAASTALSGSPAAHAQVLLQPTAVSTNMGSNGLQVIGNTIDQVGLSSSYSSGVTPLASYNATLLFASSPVWSSANITTGNVDFTLGGSYTVSSFVFWNANSTNTARVVGFTLLASPDASFATTTNLGSFTSSPTGSVIAINREVFSFTPTSASFIRMQITSNGGGGNTSFGEAAVAVAAAVTSAPEAGSGSLALLGIGLGMGLIGATGLARRRQG